MERLRVVLGGLGTRGQHWALVAERSPDVDVVAYCDPNPEALDAACEQFGPRPCFGSVRDALSSVDDVDAVVLATPPFDRMRDLELPFERSLPVLVEKPLTLDLKEAHNIVRAADAAGSPIMVGLNFRYLAVTEAQRRLLAEGTVGSPEFARFTYERYRDGRRPGINKYPLTMDQPMLWEQSIHHFDLLRYVYRAEPVRVYARTWNPSWSMYASDANVAAVFTFDGGQTVNYQGTWQGAWAEPNFEWRTDCTRGIIRQDDQFGQLSYATRDDESLTPVTLPSHEIWITETAALLDSFILAIRGEGSWECTGRDHLVSLAMVHACVLSQDHDRVVDIGEVLAAL